MLDSRRCSATLVSPALRTTLACLIAITMCLSSARATERYTPIVRAVKSCSASVVNIQGHKSINDPAATAGQRHVNGMGTGVVIDPRGFILTNFHVVDGVRQINVTLDGGRAYIARVVAHDAETDLAVIRIKSPSSLPVINFGTSDDLMPGETVIAVGNAFGYEHTVTRGIVSALHRNVQVNETQQYLDLVQTDASINPGNSGGPLLNIDGEMIGVNVAVRAGAQGIGFAIPIDRALEVAAKMLSIEEIDNHWHGITALAADGPQGPVTVARILNNSPAKSGGLQRGDQIERIGGTNIARPMDVERALLGRKTGEKVAVLVQRNGESVQLSMTLARRPGRSGSKIKSDSGAPGSSTWQILGMALQQAPKGDLRRAGVPYQGGMKVVAVRPGSSAAEQGVREGDILVRMHRWNVDSPQDVRYIVDRADSLARSGDVKFYIVRGKETFYGHMRVANSSSTSRR